MRKLFISFSAVSLASFCIPMPAHAAYQPGAVVQLPNVAAIASKSLADTVQINLSGYYAPNDGGEGVFILKTCTPDGGSCIADGTTPTPNTFYRTNLNGDIRQYGVTAGSSYDITANPTTALDATPIISSEYTALAAIGLYTVDTKQVSVILRTIPAIPQNGELTCSSGAIGPFDNGVFTGRPGTLVISHGAYVQVSSQSSAFHHCIMIPEFLANPNVVSGFGGFAFNYPAVTRDDLESIRGNMITASDIGLFLNGTGGNSNKGSNIHDLGIYGFDVCVYGTNPSFSKLNNFRGACDIGIYYAGGGGQSDSSNTDLEPFLARQVASGGTGANIKNEVFWTISTIAASPTLNAYGRPICRVTLIAGTVAFDFGFASHSSSQNTQGDPVTYPVWINGLSNSTGGLGCQGTGPYSMTAVSNTGSQAVVDLVGSEYGTGSGNLISASAQWTQGNKLIFVSTGDLTNFQIGMTVADDGSHGIPVGTTIVGIFPYSYGPDPNDGYIAQILLSNAPTITQTTDTAITLDGGAYTYPNTPCDGGGSTPCFYLNAAETEYAGTSNAGKAVASFSYSKGHHFSAGYVADGNPGFRAINTFAFAYHSTLVMNNANNCNVYDIKSDNNGELDDLGRTGLVALGGGSNCVLVGHGQGKSATSYLQDLFDVSDIHVKNSVVTTWSIATGLGTITTASSIAGWNNYAIGQHITIGMCQTYSMGCTSAEEYAFGVILGTNSIQVLARGVLNSAPISFANGMTVVQAAVTADSGSVGLTNIGLSGVTKFNNVLDIEHGGLQATGLRVNSGLDFAYFGDGITNAAIVGSTMIGVTPVYEAQSVLQTLTGCGNVWVTPQSWECLSFAPFGPVFTSSALLDFSSHDILCNASGGNVTLSVPQGALYPNWFYNVTKVDATSNLCILSMFSGDNIGGAASRPLAVQNDAVSFKNNSTVPANWVLQ